LTETADDARAEILFKVHDFGARGVSSQETAAIGAAAHLVNFLGSDTMAALLLHREFYHCETAGFSIPRRNIRPLRVGDARTKSTHTAIS
jgi:nicotinamide phosphoribosyltransferase